MAWNDIKTTTSRITYEDWNDMVADIGDISELGSMATFFDIIGRTIQDISPVGSNITIDWDLGNKCTLDVGSELYDISFLDPNYKCNLSIIINQTSIGSAEFNWPANTKWPGGVIPALSVGSDAIDIFSFMYNGSDYYGAASLDFS